MFHASVGVRIASQPAVTASVAVSGVGAFSLWSFARGQRPGPRLRIMALPAPAGESRFAQRRAPGAGGPDARVLMRQFRRGRPVFRACEMAGSSVQTGWLSFSTKEIGFAGHVRDDSAEESGRMKRVRAMSQARSCAALARQDSPVIAQQDSLAIARLVELGDARGKAGIPGLTTNFPGRCSASEIPRSE